MIETKQDTCRRLGHQFVTGRGADGKLHAVCDFCGGDRAEMLAEWRRARRRLQARQRRARQED